MSGRKASDHRGTMMQARAETGRTQRAKHRQVSGDILKLKKVEVAGVDASNLVALLRTERGNRRLIVDLGPADAIEGKVSEGARIAVEGPVVMIRDRPVLVAARTRAGRDVVAIERTRQREEHRIASQPRQRARQASGTVLQLKDVQVRGADLTNLVALVRTEEGDRRLVVDLGPKDRVEELVSEGDQIAVEGPVKVIRGRQFLVAERLRVDEETMQISRREQEQILQGDMRAATGRSR